MSLTVAPELSAPVMRLVADIFIGEYELLFKPVFEDAVQSVDYLPIEPCEELRNALDHFALAVGTAFMQDGREVPQTTVKAWFDSRARPKDHIADANLNLGQARRHLAVGRFYCIQHQIVGVILKLRTTIAGMKDEAQKSHYHKKNEALVTRFADIPRIVADRQFNLEIINREIDQFNIDSEGLTNLATDFLALAKEISTNSPVPPAVPPS
jgi:hypothetical protein